MKYHNGDYYVEVKYHRYKNHPTKNIILRKRDPPTSLRTQYQVHNETQIRRNQKVIKTDNDQLVVKSYPKNKQPKFKPLNCPSCKRNNWLELDKGYYCRTANILSTNKNIRLIKKFIDKITFFQLDYHMLIKR